MKTGLIVVLALVATAGLGLWAWNIGTQKDRDAAQPTLSGPQPASSSPGSAELEKPAAEKTRTAKVAPSTNAATKPVKDPPPAAKSKKPVAPSTGLPTSNEVATDLESGANDEQGYALKYAQASEAERHQALDILKDLLSDPKRWTADDKSTKTQIQLIKGEIEWLEAHLSP